MVNETAHLIAQWMSVGFAHGRNTNLAEILITPWFAYNDWRHSVTTGVCNTDNFSLLSITIDYGPFGFMESYDPGAYWCSGFPSLYSDYTLLFAHCLTRSCDVPDFVPNTSDEEGRYRIGAQASVGHYNLQKLLAALSPVLSEKQLGK